MAILESDIKLLKSAVMDDTTQGGGLMTGNAIVDGASNNLFPDTSEIDRALGRVNMRKVFGVAQTDSVDTLLGAHALITDAPDDPLVNCLIMQTSGWADTRTSAKTNIEQYMVKGPRLTCRLLDTHYAGSLQVRLVLPDTGTDFPTGGDAIVLRTPGGVEQFVRVLKTTFSYPTYTVTEGSGTVSFRAAVCLCDIGQALLYDFLGPPVARTAVSESSYTIIYTTVQATGAKFYGIKPLGIAASVGDFAATTSGGIFSPLVPAATIETPLIDQYPLLQNTGLSITAQKALTLPAQATFTLAANTVIYLPNLPQPGSISFTHGATAFTDDGSGVLLQGTTAVGVVNYRAKTITMSSSAPTYGSNTLTVTYSPSSPSGPQIHSDYLMVTSANVGLAFTNLLDPPPARNTLAVSFMAQGRWYVLVDNGNSKMAGADTSYGTGSISYTTGSLSVTLGALPDIGSPIIFNWGDPDSARKVIDPLPTAWSNDITFPEGVVPQTITLAWNDGTARTATTNAAGLVSSAATTGQLVGLKMTIVPTGLLFSSQITCNYNRYAGATTGITQTSANNFTLSSVPINPGTLRLTFNVTVDSGWSYGGLTTVTDDGAGNLKAWDYNVNGGTTVGTINYTTGQIVITRPYVVQWGSYTEGHSTGGFMGIGSRWVVTTTAAAHNCNFSGVPTANYTGGLASPESFLNTPSWYCQIPCPPNVPAVQSGVTFKVGGEPYTSEGGILRQNWNFATGVATTPSAGAVTASGRVQLDSLPTTKTNAIDWYNAATNRSAARISGGVFRTASAPLKSGVFQFRATSQTGATINGTINSNGDFVGGEVIGFVDSTRGWVRWYATQYANITQPTYSQTVFSGLIDPATVAYNAVFLQYLPLDATLLGLETARLPLDGKVPIYRSGSLVVLHNTQTYQMPNPLTKGTDYYVGRVRVAAMKVYSAAGVVVPSTLYTTNLDAGTINFLVGGDLTAYTQPFSVDHRIEDMMLCSSADISGKLTFTRSITHDYPANTSYLSSALAVGDVFARCWNFVEQSAWTGVWSDAIIGSAPSANFNEALSPPTTTNRGAITERWALVFTSSTAFNIIGESVGVIGTGSTGVNCSPNNPASGAPYFTVPATGWGSGWAAGNVYRFNTAACGMPIWVVRTVLQGPATLQSDKFTLAFRGDVDRP